MKEEELKELLRKYTSGTASPQEQLLVEQWYDQVDGPEPVWNEAEELRLQQQIDAGIKSRLPLSNETVQPNRFRAIYRRLSWAAIFIMIASAGIYFYINPDRPDQLTAKSPAAIPGEQVQPGSNRAVLTLADGRKINLDGARNSELAEQAGIRITKTADGEIVYETGAPNKGGKPATPVYNIISTPMGGQYHIKLADGTDVWLNAGSSLKFPAIFSGRERQVELQGEAYFEVAKNAAKPFIVQVEQTSVRVLGTHFNVMAYRNEKALETTLLEGSVQIIKDRNIKTLKPGQRSQVIAGRDDIRVLDLDDPETVISWKKGYFQFNKSDLQTVMRQISRWYDVEVIYQAKIPVKEYTGKIPRNVSAAELVDMLDYLGINCELGNDKIIVKP